MSDAEVDSAHWRALGTNVDLLVVGGNAGQARTVVESLLDEIDRTYSRFRDDSELEALNRRAGEEVAVSPLLATAVEAAIDAARRTDGRCDPTVGVAMHRIGYDRDFALLGEGGDPIELRMERVPGWETIRLDRVNRRIRTSPGVEIDLGSTGKALAADLAVAAVVDRAEVAGALVSLGGDLATSGATPAGGWRVLAAEDSTTPPDTPGEVVALHRGAIATSSTRVRRWRRGSTELHHLIDPATGLPAGGPWQTVTVVADSCVAANAVATAAIVRGESGPAWVEALGLAARFVAADGTVFRTAAWPDVDAVPDEPLVSG